MNTERLVVNARRWWSGGLSNPIASPPSLYTLNLSLVLRLRLSESGGKMSIAGGGVARRDRDMPIANQTGRHGLLSKRHHSLPTFTCRCFPCCTLSFVPTLALTALQRIGCGSLFSSQRLTSVESRQLPFE